MVRSARAITCLVMLCVLSGAPLATVLCAEWCAPSRHAASAVSSHHGASAAGHAAATPSGAPDCHGPVSGDGPRATAHTAPECLDFAFLGRDAGPVMPRLQAAAPTSLIPIVLADTPDQMLRQVVRRHDVAHASPSRPLGASPVLRI